jgi:glycosyltransferase involved in cell wall biosynthesis
VKIALVGTRGAPGRYGGFETAVEEVGSRLAARGHDVVVYCRNPGQTITEYAGMRLVNLPAWRRKHFETLSHSALSALHLLLHRVDAAVVFNAANALFIPIINAARIPVALHVDGLEWQRAKWGRNGQRYYKFNERFGVRVASELIADAVGIQDYYRETYDADSVFIPYGAPILRDVTDNRLAELGLTSRGYHLIVARLEPENNVHVAVAGYASSAATLPLVVVGSVRYPGEYVAGLQRRAAADSRISMLGGVYDDELLNQLYANSASYLHGHSVGGTNPSLLRAMGAAAPVLAWDVNFNREVLAETGAYWSTPDAVANAIELVESDLEAARERGLRGQVRAAEQYRWDAVAEGYEQLCERLAARSRR